MGDRGVISSDGSRCAECWAIQLLLCGVLGAFSCCRSDNHHE